MTRFTLCAAVLLTASVLHAQDNKPQDMSHCVKMGKLMNAGTIQEFVNACDRPIKLYLCRAPGGCGSRKSFHPYFTGRHIVEPGSSQLVRVVDGSHEFHVAACSFGRKDGVLWEPVPVMLDAKGKYMCELSP